MFGRRGGRAGAIQARGWACEGLSHEPRWSRCGLVEWLWAGAWLELDLAMSRDRLENHARPREWLVEADLVESLGFGHVLGGSVRVWSCWFWARVEGSWLVLT